MRMEINIKPVPREDRDIEKMHKRERPLPQAVREFVKRFEKMPSKKQQLPKTKLFGRARYLEDVGAHFPGDPPQVIRPSSRG